MPKVIKPSNPFTNVCWVSVLTTFSAATNFNNDVFRPPQKRRNDKIESFGATAAGLFEQ